MTGAAPSLAQVYLEKRTALLRFFALRLGSQAAAEDLVQDIYVKLLDRPDLGADIANPAAYLYRLGANLMLDRLKQQRRSMTRDAAWHGLGEAAGGQDIAEAPGADAVVAGRQRLAAVIAALADLNASQRQAFELHKLKGLSHGETAQVMGVSKSSVEKHISAVLRHLLARGL